MESEDLAKEEDFSMKLLSNKAEIPDYKSGGDLDVTIKGSEEFEDISDTLEYKKLQRELRKDRKV